MSIKWIGAMMIIFACAAVGFSMAAGQRREEKCLRQLLTALDYMACELQYRLTPLPELCALAATESSGCVGQVLRRLSDEMERQIRQNAEECIAVALETVKDIPAKTEEAFCLLGSSLGKFDMEGQLRGLELVRGHCRLELEKLTSCAEERLRSYQTLGICTGAALAILFV